MRSLGTLDGHAVRGALNVVLRTDLDGFEARTVVRMPTRDGGDGRQVSAFWGGAIGAGRMTLGADVLRREEITARSRDYSRSVWQEGGSFNEARNISVGGNTVWVVQRDEAGDRTGMRSVPLGECDPAKGYTGPLRNPPGITSGDRGCGFAYGNIMWNTGSYEQRSAILNPGPPARRRCRASRGRELHAGASPRSATRRRSARSPSLRTGSCSTRSTSRPAATRAGAPFEADGNDFFVVAHRFVRHGNRDWLADTDEVDASVERRGPGSRRVSATMRASAPTGGTDSWTATPSCMRGTIQSEIQTGRYDLENPFTDDPEHEQAIGNSSLRLENDFGGEYLGARLALEGSRFSIGGRNAAWTAGTRAGERGGA